MKAKNRKSAIPPYTILSLIFFGAIIGVVIHGLNIQLPIISGETGMKIISSDIERAGNNLLFESVITISVFEAIKEYYESGYCNESIYYCILPDSPINTKSTLSVIENITKKKYGEKAREYNLPLNVDLSILIDDGVLNIKAKTNKNSEIYVGTSHGISMKVGDLIKILVHDKKNDIYELYKKKWDNNEWKYDGSGIRDRVQRYLPIIEEASVKAGIDPYTLGAMLLTESNMYPVSKGKESSACGIAQFVDKTWVDTVNTNLAREMGIYGLMPKGCSEDDPRLNPEYSIKAAAIHISSLQQQLDKILGKRVCSNTGKIMLLRTGYHLGGGIMKRIARDTCDPIEVYRRAYSEATSYGSKGVDKSEEYESGMMRFLTFYDLIGGVLTTSNSIGINYLHLETDISLPINIDLINAVINDIIANKNINFKIEEYNSTINDLSNSVYGCLDFLSGHKQCYINLSELKGSYLLSFNQTDISLKEYRKIEGKRAVFSKSFEYNGSKDLFELKIDDKHIEYFRNKSSFFCEECGRILGIWLVNSTNSIIPIVHYKEGSEEKITGMNIDFSENDFTGKKMETYKISLPYEVPIIINNSFFLRWDNLSVYFVK